ncbi:MAG: GFA family protein [Rhizobiales bacterium]|nr:GFA family protein [Hyphomicrobiales bacterium]
MTSHQGRCQCGAVSFDVTAEPIMSGFCHCLDCQKASGAPHVMHVAFPEQAIRVRGETRGFQSPADSGGTVTREFCPICGSRLFGSSTTLPGMKTVHAAAFDDPAAFSPMMTVYAKRALQWDQVAANLPSFLAMPPNP